MGVKKEIKHELYKSLIGALEKCEELGGREKIKAQIIEMLEKFEADGHGKGYRREINLRKLLDEDKFGELENELYGNI